MARERLQVAFKIVGLGHGGLQWVRVLVMLAHVGLDHRPEQRVLDAVLSVAEVGVDGLL